MDKVIIFLLLAFAMFLGSYICGFSPIWLVSKARNINTVSIYGAGLMIGVSLLIIIPEGMNAIYYSGFNRMKAQTLLKNSTKLEIAALEFEQIGIYYAI